jgi:hypothetical protein
MNQNSDIPYYYYYYNKLIENDTYIELMKWKCNM